MKDSSVVKISGFICSTVITCVAFLMGYDGQLALLVTAAILGVNVYDVVRQKNGS